MKIGIGRKFICNTNITCNANNLTAKNVSQIELNTELDRILESANLDEFKLLDSPREQQDGSSQELLCVGSAPVMDTSSIRWGWHPMKGVTGYCARELTLARGLLCLPLLLFPHVTKDIFILEIFRLLKYSAC